MEVAFVAPFVLAVSYLLWFAWALEFFRLGRHHGKRSLFIVGMAVPWAFLPMFSAIFSALWLTSLSPYIGIPFMTGIALRNKPDAPYWPHIALAANIVLSVVMYALARRERTRLEYRE